MALRERREEVRWLWLFMIDKELKILERRCLAVALTKPRFPDHRWHGTDEFLPV